MYGGAEGPLPLNSSMHGKITTCRLAIACVRTPHIRDDPSVIALPLVNSFMRVSYVYVASNNGSSLNILTIPTRTRGWGYLLSTVELGVVSPSNSKTASPCGSTGDTMSLPPPDVSSAGDTTHVGSDLLNTGPFLRGGRRPDGSLVGNSEMTSARPSSSPTSPLPASVVGRLPPTAPFSSDLAPASHPPGAEVPAVAASPASCFFCRRRKKKIASAISRRAPNVTPTPTPALAPELRPAETSDAAVGDEPFAAPEELDLDVGLGVLVGGTVRGVDVGDEVGDVGDEVGGVVVAGRSEAWKLSWYSGAKMT